MNPQLTIVVPVRDMSGKLGNLRSWLGKQALDSLEIIIVEDKDDAATSLELIELVDAINSPRIKLISGKFGSPGLSRNAGKEVAGGKWIAFWDADDTGYPDVALKEIGELGDRSTNDLLVFSFDIRDWTTHEILSKKPIDSQNGSLSTILDYPGIWRMCFRTDLIKDLYFPSYRMAEDQVFFARVINKAPNIKFLDPILYSYFKNVPGQLTRSIKAISDLIYSTRDISSFLDASPRNPFFIELFIRQCFSGIRHGNPKERLKFLLMMLKFALTRDSLLRIRVVSKVLFS